MIGDGTAEQRADRLRSQACAKRAEANRLEDEARAIEDAVGLVPPCHLCGSRECNH